MLRALVRQDWACLERLAPGSDAGDSTFCAFLAGEHLAHFAVDALDRAGPNGVLPAEWLAVLRAEVSRRNDLAAQLPGAMLEAVGALQAAGVDSMVLKGLPMALRFYGSPGARRLIDVDLLVKRADVDRAIGALARLGYSARARRVDVGPAGLHLRDTVVRSEHAIAMSRGRVHLDVHWRLRSAPAYRIDEVDVWGAPVSVDIDRIPVRTLSDEYSLTLLLLSIAEDLARCACRAKHVLDAFRVSQRMEAGTDWRGFFARRRGQNVERVTVSAARVLLDYLACRDELPRLSAVVDALPGVAGAPDESIRLMHRSRGSVENTLWFMRAYPVEWARDARWFLGRHLRHPGRWYTSAYRAARFVARAGLHVAGAPLRGLTA